MAHQNGNTLNYNKTLILKCNKVAYFCNNLLIGCILIMQESKIITHFNRKESEEFAKDIAKFELKTGFELGAEVANGTPPKKMSKTTIVVPIVEKFPPPIDPKVQKEVPNVTLFVFPNMSYLILYRL
jgi:hypothetical protein